MISARYNTVKSQERGEMNGKAGGQMFYFTAHDVLCRVTVSVTN